ncbi:MAG: DUF3050 domain-containing protein [Sphingobacteriaceae bacterium]|nr:DUF3050 domain-containing protein [Sphingobacteriaceae bacterium]
MTSTQFIQQEIADLRQELVNHPVYKKINSKNDLRIFMQHHVFAVWDFMSLLKALQNNLTCVKSPWLPVGSPATRFLINEIVVGEESDIDQEGNHISHFELYLNAMQQAGAKCSAINRLIEDIKNGVTITDALNQLDIDESIKNFVRYTFKIIEDNKAYVQAAVFTFGREDLIPDMFIAMVKDINIKTSNDAAIFQYYLERHIEVDGDHHSHLAIAMTENLIGTEESKKAEALEAVKLGLKHRIDLWDGVLAALEKQVELA